MAEKPITYLESATRRVRFDPPVLVTNVMVNQLMSGLPVDFGTDVPKEPAAPDRSDDALAEENRRLFDALERAREYVERASYDAFDDREDRLLAVIDAALKGDGL